MDTLISFPNLEPTGPEFPPVTVSETGVLPEEAAGQTAELHRALTHTFGYNVFRPHQLEIVRNIVDGRDVFAVMPTRGGKSLCYQLPARVLNGTAVVISPLIALMKDQVDAARQNNLAASFLNSSLSASDASSVYREMQSGVLDLLYISPERFALEAFVKSLKQMPISFFAVDEAHCLSEWGHDFRPDYLGLSGIRRHFPEIPIAAFTATATSLVATDIRTKLALRNPYLVRASFNRPNLYYEVRAKQKVEAQILDFVRSHPEDPGIVYRTTRDSVEKTAAFLAKHGINALPYHAGLPQNTRVKHQEAFSRDEAQVIVATIAFGMGIDKSNVRFVLHADLPKSMEGYYQETGRAGRDGDASACVLFYGGGDIPKLRHFLDQMPEGPEKDSALKKLNQMAEFASRFLCRRRQLLAYFEEVIQTENCASCDICKGLVETVDASRETQMLISAIVRTGERFGAGHVIDILLGADTQRIRDLGHDALKTHGVGKHKDRNYWRFLAGELVARNILALDPGPYPILKLTGDCLPLLKGEANFEILKGRDEVKERKKAGKNREADSGSEPTGDDGLFQALRALRKTLAAGQGIPPYMVFSDKTLHEMCTKLPVTLADLREVSGVGDAKLERYGEEFVRAIIAYDGNSL